MSTPPISDYCPYLFHHKYCGISKITSYLMWLSRRSLGFTLYLWLQFQCTQVKTAVEYQRLHNKLTKFLSRIKTTKDIIRGCIKAMVNLQNQLSTLESKLAAYNRMAIKCCMDACTMSPAECWNYIIKHIMKCNSRINIDNVFRKMCVGTNDRINCMQNKAKRELCQ